jgi:hypothetical protein
MMTFHVGSSSDAAREPGGRREWRGAWRCGPRRGDEVGGAQDSWRGDEIGDDHRDAPLEAELGQRQLDRAGDVAEWRDQEMRIGQHELEQEARRSPAMLCDSGIASG